MSSELEQIPESMNESPGRMSIYPEEEQFFSDPVEELEEVDGQVFCFAYALPYTYGEMMNDLEQAKKFLVGKGGAMKTQMFVNKEGSDSERGISK